MRRTYLFFGLIVAAFTTTGVVWWHRTGEAKQPRPLPPAAAAQQVLPLTQVVLFTTGIGYFHREGAVDGDAHVDLSVALKDVNDLLKSLVLEDLGGGKCSAVNYDSQEPVENTLRGFAIDLTGGPNVAQLLDQARGEKVEIKTQGNPTVPGTLSGSIIGLETQADGQKPGVVFLNLFTVDGVRTIPLSTVQSFRFLNPVLDADFRNALDVLARTHDNQKKRVTFHFTGEGKRDVRLGYVAESPMWKVNYRFVFDKDGKPRLQAWAVVENTTDEDWTDVRLTLASARPISFTMDQYQPLFIPRPSVEPEMFALLRPPVFGGALTDGTIPRGTQFGGQLGGFGGQFGGQFGGLGGQFGGGFAGQPVQQVVPARGWQRSNQTTLHLDPTTGLPVQPPSSELSFKELQDRRRAAQVERDKARQVATSLAAFDFKDVGDALAAKESGEIDESFQYVIDQKVTIARQKCALIPILDQEVRGRRVSLFNERTEAKTPLLGLRFENTTGKPLLQGPAMVFDGGRYAGDARLQDLRAGEERYLAYAVDLGLEIKAVEPEAVGAFVKETPGAAADKMLEGSVVVHWPSAVKMVHGNLRVTRTERATKEFLLKNRSREDRLVIIEHPVDSRWKLVAPKAVEASRDYYRFEVEVPAGQSVHCDLVRERAASEDLVVTSLDRNGLNFFLDGTLAGPVHKAAIRTILQRREELRAVENECSAAQRKVADAVNEHTRLRDEIDYVPKDSEVHRRFLALFDAQHPQIEKLKAQRQEKEVVMAQKQKEFADFVHGLSEE